MEINVIKLSVNAVIAVLLGVNASYAGESALETLSAAASPSVLSAMALPEVPKGYIGSNGAQGVPVEWVTITGGKYIMGTNDEGTALSSAKPAHEVAVRTFEMSKTLVTVEQYAECVTRGQCKKTRSAYYCNWGVEGRQKHPINCVSWEQANQYAKFKGARLPSESEWEYAATSGGKDQRYPWGNEAATCERAVMPGPGGSGCGNNSTMPVCSKPAGNTAQGLCDMSGNAFQWVQDRFRNSYKGAPVDGSAFEAGSELSFHGRYRVARGGSYRYEDPGFLRADARYHYDNNPTAIYGDFGIRLAR